jgi:hypothetical protein
VGIHCARASRAERPNVSRNREGITWISLIGSACEIKVLDRQPAKRTPEETCEYASSTFSSEYEERSTVFNDQKFAEITLFRKDPSPQMRNTGFRLSVGSDENTRVMASRRTSIPFSRSSREKKIKRRGGNGSDIKKRLQAAKEKKFNEEL